ncbi:MAG: NnrS family protein [Magnetococcales bacterium]|nr:NnrS family protein [Magnetococcales bacterium]
MQNKIPLITIKPQLHQIGEPETRSGPVLFAYGFRPFFLLGSLWGVLAMTLWLMILYGPLESPGLLPSSWWHGHEMIFGFVAAMAAGFLLTAVTNWTQTTPLRGIPLMALAGIWLLGRIFMWLAPEGALWVVAALDLAFLPGLMIAITLPVVRTKKYHQGVFPALVGLLWLANLMFHLEWLGIVAESAVMGMRLGVDAILWLIVIFGGRMLPSFTQNALSALGTRGQLQTWPFIEHAANWSMAVVSVLDLLFLDHWATGYLFIIVAVIHAVRLSGWQTHRVLNTPIVWVLHLGYAWLAAGFVFRGVSVLTDGMLPTTAIHALTVGCFGITIMGIMTRVSLAHTGRPLQPKAILSGLFILLALTALLRLDLVPIDYGWAVSLSGIAWVCAFLVFFLEFFPILTQPRVDGRPG